MIIVYWPPEENAGAEDIAIETLTELWELVRTKKNPVQENHILELSANESIDGSRYLVLAWVEVTE